MTELIKLKISDIPEYLHNSKLYKSFNDDDNEEEENGGGEEEEYIIIEKSKFKKSLKILKECLNALIFLIYLYQML